MKKILCILLAIMISASVMTVCFAADKSFDLAACETDATAIADGIKMLEDKYVKIPKVDLDGIKSVTVTATCLMPTGTNGDALAVKTDDPLSGAILGYVVINNEDKTEFSANLAGAAGTHDVYLVSEYAREHQITLKKAVFSGNTVSVENKAISDDKIKDNYADTWAATDSLGRKVADYAEAGAVKTGDRYVGIMYWDWHVKPDFSVKLIPDVVKANPDTWWQGGEHWPSSTVYYWGEPLLGFYSSFEYWTYLKHATWLANAGVDAICLDYTNTDTEYIKSLGYLKDAFHQAREYGINAPKIIPYCPTGRPESARIAKVLWFNLYSDESNSDLWFYLDGKPLLIGPSRGDALKYANKADAAEVALINEIYDNVTVRNQGNRLGGGGWDWLDNFPVKENLLTKDGRVEEMAVGISINHDYVKGSSVVGKASDPYTKDKGYSEVFGEDYSEGSLRSATFFREQASQVLDTDPMFVYVDGWNEWTALGGSTDKNATVGFVDCFDDANSRDIEPAAGALKDDYYNLLVDFVRKYKGVRPAPVASAAKTVDISGSIDQWNDVLPEYVNDYDNYERSGKGIGNIEYETKINNSIASAKAARDNENLYFMVKTVNDITTGTNEFLHLYINADRNYFTGWEGYDFAFGRTPGALEKYENGAWMKIADAAYNVSANVMQVKLPLSALGLTPNSEFEFKWVDGAGEIASGDFMTLYKNGSVAPMGRFNYLYITKEQTTLNKNERDNLYKTAVLKAGNPEMVVSGARVDVYEKDNTIVPFEYNGTLYIPADSISEILYGESKVTYDPYSNIVKVKTFMLDEREESALRRNISDVRNTYTVLGSNEMHINGKAGYLSNPVTAVNGIIYIPLTYLSECLNFKVLNAGDGVWAISRLVQPDVATTNSALKVLG